MNLHDAKLCAFSFQITGRVQGVGFRRFAQKAARKHGVSGWVKNLEDGSVAGMIRGERAQIETLLSLLRKGPRFSRVDSVDFQPLTVATVEELADVFEIR